MDLSPNLGGLAQDLAINLGISQLPAYTFQLSLNHLMWGYQLGVFYTQEEYSQQAIADLSDWYGVQYVLLNSQMDDSTRFPTSDWSVIHHDDEIVLLESIEERQPASRLEKPTLLVIGDTSGSVYYDLFRMANEGLAPYDEFLFVDGSRGIDEYTQDELSAFDILLLHGYHYRDATRAWTLLGEYVRDGGSLFIDTGWQYKIPHWEFEQAPDVLPMDRLTWTSYGRDNAYSINADAIDSQIEANEFAPLVWEDHAWGVSGGEIGDVRDWAVPVLTSHGKPLLLAGEYGQGRVVWSGMNLISHINAYGNDQEKAFLRDLILWLAEGIETREWGAPEILRDVPDEIRFTISETSSELTWLLWRESYYPNWHASWSSQEGQQPVPVYRAGPGLMLLPLPPTATTAVLTLSWEPDAWARAGILGSVLGFAGLVALLLDGLLLKGEGFTWLKIAFLVRTPRPFLGEGPNIEWAERKREELVTGFAGPQSAIADADVTASGSDDLGSSSIAQKSPGYGFDPLSRADPASRTPEEAAEESLLRSWLEKTGHAEDAWAEKLLRRRRSGKRGRGEE